LTKHHFDTLPVTQEVDGSSPFGTANPKARENAGFFVDILMIPKTEFEPQKFFPLNF